MRGVFPEEFDTRPVDVKEKVKAEKAAVEAQHRETVLRDEVVDTLKDNGLDVSMNTEEGQRVLDEANEDVRMSAKKRGALETVSVSRDEKHQPTVVSSATGAKILKNIETLATELDKSSTQPKTFIGRLYCAVEIDGKTYRVKTTMQEFRGGEDNKPHSYEVTKIELLDSPGKREIPDRPHSDAPSNSISTAKLLEGVEKSYDKGKKLLDEIRDLTDGENSFGVDNKNSQSSTPVTDTVANIGKVVEKISKKLGVKVHAVSHISEITDPQVRRYIMRGKKVQGWYDEKTGEVHLYLPNIHDSYTAEKTVWYETVGHKGMRGLLGDLILAILQVRNELNCFEHVFLSCVTKRKLSIYSTAVSPSNTIFTKAQDE